MANRIRYASVQRKTVTVGPAKESARERAKWYRRAAWLKLRAAQLAEHPLCAMCLAEGQTMLATVVHHVKERLTHPELALDQDNLESLCSPHHTAEHTKRRLKK
jgi:5-methylcytosine-specific restriction protein A